MTDSVSDRANQNGIDFVFIDLDLANIFIDVAAASQSEEMARRNQSNARKAYDTVIRLLPRLRPGEQERHDLNRKLSLLKGRLQAIGQQF
jgi:hypothetical protein